MSKVEELQEMLGTREDRFKPKMNERQRCQILALSVSGASRHIVASMFGVDPRTVSHITSDNSPHYKAVRKMLRSMGKDAFVSEYVDEELMTKLRAAKGEAPSLSYVRASDLANDDGPSMRASRMAGIHQIKPDQCFITHTIEIAWVDPEKSGGKVDKAGWYYRDTTSDMPDVWFMAGDEDSIKTSKACYDAVLLNIMD